MRRRALAGIVVAVLALLAVGVRHQIHGLSLVVRAADLQGPLRRLADADTVSVTERVARIPVQGESIRARIYAPAHAPRQTVLLVSGLHPAGVDEPRLVALARKLAEADVIVVTPEIPELARFEITPLLTDRIEQAALWLATESGLAHDGRIGLMGVSFSGGLAVVAAGRSPLRAHLSYVFSLGGHDDLRRVLEYYCSGIERAPLGDGGPGRSVDGAGPPHDYGVAVVLLNVADRLVPLDQVEPLRDGVRRFLWASFLERTDASGAAREFAALRELVRHLPEPSSTLMGYVNDRDVARLGPRLLPYLGSYADAPGLSPSRSPAPFAPVFLLHGRDDNVIPSLESRYLADRLRGQVPVRLLVTDLISHAEADHPAHVFDVLDLARFWGDLLRQ